MYHCVLRGTALQKKSADISKDSPKIEKQTFLDLDKYYKKDENGGKSTDNRSLFDVNSKDFFKNYVILIFLTKICSESVRSIQKFISIVS